MITKFVFQQKNLNLCSMEKSKHLLRNCPICKCNKGKILHTQHFSLPDKSVLPNVYDVVSCEDCGFCFADSAATQADYDKYYNEMSKYEDKNTGSGSGLAPLDKLRMDIVVDLLAQFIPQKSHSIVDIGCANGGMLNCFHEKGFSNLIGIDISQKCVSNVKALGFESYFGGIFSLEKIKDKKFDVVTVSHVMEHIKDLKTAAINLSSLIAEDGLLYIEVPDASKYAQYYFVPYYYFDCEHINHFNITALTNLFLGEGLECLYYEERSLVVSDDKEYPVLRVVFKKTIKNNKQEIEKDEKVTSSIKGYIKLSESNSTFNELNNFIHSKEEIFVWGAGMYTLRLLQDSKLGECNIQYYIDKDSNKQGNKLNGISIISPEILKQHKNTPIIIASAIHGKAIKEEIVLIDGNPNRKTIIL